MSQIFRYFAKIPFHSNNSVKWLSSRHIPELLKTFQSLQYFENFEDKSLLALLSLRPYGSRDFEIASCEQHCFFILLGSVCPWFVFNFKIILKHK